MENTVPIIDYSTCGQWFTMESEDGGRKMSAQQYIRQSFWAEWDNGNPYAIQHFSDDTILCAGNAYGNNDACQGDSGGPLICVDDGKPVLQGVVSWGVRCGERLLPGVYTRVAHYSRWIQAETNISYKNTFNKLPKYTDYVNTSSGCFSKSCFAMLILPFTYLFVLF